MSSDPAHPVPQAILAAVKSDDVRFLTGCADHGLPVDFHFPVPLPSEPDLLQNSAPLLCVAAYYGALNIVRYLLTNGANPTESDDEGRSAVFYAAASGHIATLLALAELGVDIAGCGQAAVRFGNLPYFQELISRSLIQISDQDFCRNTFLHIAAFEGHLNIVAYLLSLPSPPIGARDRDGRTPLHLAAGNGHFPVCELLLRAGADPRAQDAYDKSPIAYAAVQERFDIVELLLGGRLNELDGEGLTPLIRAVRDDTPAMVQLLLEMPQVDPNVRDGEGSPALHRAIRTGKKFSAKLLLGCERTDANAQDRDGQTAMHWAVRKREMELVQALLKRPGTNIHIPNAAGKTALEELNEKLDRPPKQG
jgi:ankyrin